MQTVIVLGAIWHGTSQMETGMGVTFYYTNKLTIHTRQGRLQMVKWSKHNALEPSIFTHFAPRSSMGFWRGGAYYNRGHLS